MKLEIRGHTLERFTIDYGGARWSLNKTYGMWRLGHAGEEIKLAGGTHPYELVLANALMKIREISESARILPFPDRRTAPQHPSPAD